MPDGGALVENDAPGLLQLGNDGAGRVASRLYDLDALVDDDLRVSLVIRRHQRGQQRDVYGEGLAGQFPALAYLLTQSLWLGPNQGRQDAQASRVGNRTCQLCIPDMLEEDETPR